MAKELFKLTQKLHNKPHLCTQAALVNVSTYLHARNFKLDGWDENYESVPVGDNEPETEVFNGIGVINVHGLLMNKSTEWDAMCGGCSYEDILDQADDIIEAGARTIVLNINSCGGEAYGCFLAAKSLRDMCDQSNVNLIGYIDGDCFSGAYAIGCVCDELISNPYGEAGSVGVVVSLCDDSQYMKDMGLKPIYITGGKEKVPYAADGSFKQSFLDELQNKIDVMYTAFVEHVSFYTGLSTEAVYDTEARTYLAKDALDIGLINKIMPDDEFIDYISNLGKKGNMNA